MDDFREYKETIDIVGKAFEVASDKERGKLIGFCLGILAGADEPKKSHQTTVH